MTTEKKLILVFTATATTQEERKLLNCKPGTNTLSLLGNAEGTNILHEDTLKVKKEKVFAHLKITPTENLLRYSRIETRLFAREECTNRVIEELCDSLQNEVNLQLVKDGYADLAFLYNDDPTYMHKIAVLIAPEGFDPNRPELPIIYSIGEIGLSTQEINCFDRHLKRELYQANMNEPAPENFDFRNLVIIPIDDEIANNEEALKMFLYLLMASLHTKEKPSCDMNFH